MRDGEVLRQLWMAAALDCNVRPGVFVGVLPDSPDRTDIVPRDDGLGAHDMRRDELMKPDLFSEALLTVVGLAMLIFLVSTLWIAIVGH